MNGINLNNFEFIEALIRFNDKRESRNFRFSAHGSQFSLNSHYSLVT